MKTLRTGTWVLLPALLAPLAGCGDEQEGTKEIKVNTGKGQVTMRYLDLVEGKGETVKPFDTILVHYTGWLSDGTKFDSSLDHGGKPFDVMIGAGDVIRGWDEGIPGMKVGGKRKLFIPPELAYGDKGAKKAIPPGAKLTFEVEVLKILKPGESKLP